MLGFLLQPLSVVLWAMIFASSASAGSPVRVVGAPVEIIERATVDKTGIVRFAGNGVASAGRAVMATDVRLVAGAVPHAPIHRNGGVDPIGPSSTTTAGLTQFAPNGVASQGRAVMATDVRLGSVSYTPHATQHMQGASDAISPSSVSTAGLARFAAPGVASSGRAVMATDPRLADARVAVAHQSSHRVGASDGLPAGSTSTAGLILLAGNGEVSGLKAVAANDARLSAGGASDLTTRSGMVSYPPPKRWASSITYSPADSAAIMWGGRISNPPAKTDTWKLVGDRWTKVWDSNGGSVPEPTESPVLVYDSIAGCVYAMGGTPLYSGFVAHVLWKWQGGQWTNANADYQYGGGIAACYDAGRGGIVYTEGVAGNGYTSMNTRFRSSDGGGWVDLQLGIPGYGVSYVLSPTHNTPGSVLRGAMVYDSTRNTPIFFGGFGGDPGAAQSAGWRLGDDNKWTAIAMGPGARERFGMAYDIHRDRVVIFGGLAGDGTSKWYDTWEFDGSSWTQRQPAHQPSARDNLAMTYDPAIRRTVVYGGYSPSFQPLDDTWFWDGSDWSQEITSTELAAGTVSIFSDLRVTAGVDRSMLRATLVDGEVTVTDSRLTDATNIFCFPQVWAGTPGVAIGPHARGGPSITFWSVDGSGQKQVADQSTFAILLVQPYTP